MMMMDFIFLNKVAFTTPVEFTSIKKGTTMKEVVTTTKAVISKSQSELPKMG